MKNERFIEKKVARESEIIDETMKSIDHVQRVGAVNVPNEKFTDFINHTISDTRVSAINTVLLEKMLRSMGSVMFDSIKRNMIDELKNCNNLDDYKDLLATELTFRHMVDELDGIDSSNDPEKYAMAG